MSTTTTTHDYPALVRAELADLRALLPQLTEEQWETPSLCEGWRVRDVIGHACTGYSYSVPKVLGLVVKSGFNVPKGSGRAAVEFASSRSTPELVEAFNTATTPDKPKGFVKTMPWPERFVDHTIHEQDIRRPLGIRRDFPPERLRAALDALPKVGGFARTKQRVKGLRLVATDIDYVVGEGGVGEGPEVRGPAEALILAASGRPVALPELEGDGVAILRERIGA